MHVIETIARAIHEHIEIICATEGIDPMPWEECPEKYRQEMMSAGAVVQRTGLAWDDVIACDVIEDIVDVRMLMTVSRKIEEHFNA